MSIPVINGFKICFLLHVVDVTYFFFFISADIFLLLVHLLYFISIAWHLSFGMRLALSVSYM